MNFSERLGIKPIRKVIQENSMDDSLRNSLWNVFSLIILRAGKDDGYAEKSTLDRFFKRLWINFFKMPIETIPNSLPGIIHFISEKVLNTFDWNEVYEFIEYVLNDSICKEKNYSETFCKACNIVLKREMSAYRFVDKVLIKISDENEILTIERALENAEENKLKGVQIHLQTSLKRISDRQNPDYRNSIKESISAIESICQVISNDENAELGKALKNLRGKIEIHPALEQGFSKIYGYTSDSDGIRHAMMDETKLDYEDAMYMLVSCSAFVNYLIVKSQKAGINFQ